MQSWPTGTSRIVAISSVTFAPGSTPPMPGFAPWESLSETIFTCGSCALAANLSGSKSPSGVRAPKYPVPSSQMRSPPNSRWYGEIDPSPVSCAKPPIAAPLLSARTALSLSDPKLIAETLSREISYGWVQSFPPTRIRGGAGELGIGAFVCMSASYPVRATSRSVPKACSEWMPFDRS